MVTADRFHIAKLYREVVDELRKAEMQRLKKALPEEQYAKFKGAMWLVRKDPRELDDHGRDILRLLFDNAPLLKTVDLFSETLTGIFEKPYTKAEAESSLRAWMGLVRDAVLPCFERFLHTLDEKMDLITNYFIRRQSSGLVEGLNHKIRVLLWRSYGMFNRVHLFQRLTLDLGGYAQFV